MRESTNEISMDTWKQWILEAISKIRSQKQRPSVQRICQAIGTHHKFHEDIVAEKLEQAVEKGSVIKVYNKGLHSYKAPMAKRRIKVDKSTNLYKLVAKAVNDLGECEGSTVKNIENYIQKFNSIELSPNADFKSVIKSSVKKAVDIGFLVQDGKLYKKGKSLTTPRKSLPESDTIIKGEETCAHCSGNSQNNLNEIPEPLSSCKNCGVSLHTTCANIAGKCKSQSYVLLYMLVTKGSIWNCQKCADCSVCKFRNRGPCLLQCFICNKHFHLTCLDTTPDKKPKYPYRCNSCLSNDRSKSLKRDSGNLNIVQQNDRITPFGNINKKFDSKRQIMKNEDCLENPSTSQKCISITNVKKKIKPCPEINKHDLQNKQKNVCRNQIINQFCRKRTFSNLSSTTSSSDSDEENDDEESNLICEDQNETTTSDSCTSSSSDSESSDSSSDSSDGDDDNEDDYDTDKSTIKESISENGKSVEYRSGSSANENEPLNDKSENWGFAAVAKNPLDNRYIKSLKYTSFSSDKSENFKNCLLTSKQYYSNLEKKKKIILKSVPLEANKTLKNDDDIPYLTKETVLKCHIINEKVKFSKLDKTVQDQNIPSCENKMFLKCLNSVQSDQNRVNITQEKEHIPHGVSLLDVNLYQEVLQKAFVNVCDKTPEKSSFHQSGQSPKSIEIGKWNIETWYSSPFPQEYARLIKLYFCEFCLKYTKSRSVLDRHQNKCVWRQPPGTEIFRQESISVFEVDGNVNKIYCQNLCLLSKFFLDHKTLYYDVEPFLFYILTKNDSIGCHIVGYFSKEKHCSQRYNVSCILTLPQYQRQGYGRFLIDFSYLLSREEGQLGTPEKPLSDLGRLSYFSYWKSIILEYLYKYRYNQIITFKDIAIKTGLTISDIALTFELLNFIKLRKNDGDIRFQVTVKIDWNAVVMHNKLKSQNKTRICIEADCLRWSPLMTIPKSPNNFIIPVSNREYLGLKKMNEEKELCKFVGIVESPTNIIVDGSNNLKSNIEKACKSNDVTGKEYNFSVRNLCSEEVVHLTYKRGKGTKRVLEGNGSSDFSHSKYSKKLSELSGHNIVSKHASRSVKRKDMIPNINHFEMESNINPNKNANQYNKDSQNNSLKLNSSLRGDVQEIDYINSEYDKPINTVPKLRGKKSNGKWDEERKTDFLPNTENILFSKGNPVVEEITISKDSLKCSNDDQVLDAVAKKTKKALFSESAILEIENNAHDSMKYDKKNEPVDNPNGREVIIYEPQLEAILPDVGGSINSNFCTSENDKIILPAVDENKPVFIGQNNIEILDNKNEKLQETDDNKVKKAITPTPHIKNVSDETSSNNIDTTTEPTVSSKDSSEDCREHENVKSKSVEPLEVNISRNFETQSTNNNERDLIDTTTKLNPGMSTAFNSQGFEAKQKINKKMYLEEHFPLKSESIVSINKQSDSEHLSSANIVSGKDTQERAEIIHVKKEGKSNLCVSSSLHSNVRDKMHLKANEHSQLQNSISSQFPINQMPNYHHTSQYWQWDYYSYNLCNLDPSSQKGQKQFHKDLTTTMAYTHNFTQNLYQSANLAMHAHHQIHHTKDKPKADKKNNGKKDELLKATSNINANNSSRDLSQSINCNEYNTNTCINTFEQKCSNQQKQFKAPDQTLQTKPTNNIQTNISRHTHSNQSNTSSALSGSLNQESSSPLKQKLEDLPGVPRVEKVKVSQPVIQSTNHSNLQISDQTDVTNNNTIAYTAETSTNAPLQHYDCGINVEISMDTSTGINHESGNSNVLMQRQFPDCSMQNQSTTTPMHMSIQNTHIQQDNINVSLTNGSPTLNIICNSQHQQPNRKLTSQPEIISSTSSTSHRESTPKQIRSGSSSTHAQQRDTKAPNGTSAQSSVHQHPQSSIPNISKIQQDGINSLQFTQLGGQHSQQQNMQTLDYLPISPNFSTNPSNYDVVGMPTVIQQRMSLNSSVHCLSNSHQRMEQPSSTCAVNNFYLQNNMTSNEIVSNAPRIPNSTTNGPSSSVVSNDQSLSSNNSGTTSSIVGNLCSLSKLQQLTNCLESQSCNTSPSAQVNLISSPHHSIPPNSMTPPPHLIMQNRNISTPPNMLQTQVTPLQYHKYYTSNMNITPAAQNTNRNNRHTPSAPNQHSSTISSSSNNRASNVHISPNLMSHYGAINSYRMSPQQSSPVTAYSSSGDYPNSQIPMQVGVMNMQSQYQDACVLQRATQTNAMYPSYSPYLPLNGSIRR